MRKSDHHQQADAAIGPTVQEKIELVKWHIVRYDQLRTSAANRASVVLSAGALLSAGNAVVLSELFANQRTVKGIFLILYSAGIIASLSLIVLSLINATGVLVSLRVTRRLFPDEDLPPGLLFNATDTLHSSKSFRDFQTRVAVEDYFQILEHAEVELWIVIQGYKYRYAKLRGAVGELRAAALIFLALLVTLVVYLALST
jgi:hypothetical protein